MRTVMHGVATLGAMTLLSCASGVAVRVPAGVLVMGSVSSDPDRDEDEGPRITLRVHELLFDRTPVSTEDFQRRAIEIRALDPGARWWTEEETPIDWAGRCNLASTRTDHPVNCVDWRSARAYCALEGKDLPTEAEWELAARGDRGHSAWRFPWGPSFEASRVVSSVGCGSRGCRGGTSELQREGPRCNAWGVCDLSANVWQWTRTEYREQLGAYVNSSTAAQPLGRPVIRGGSWENHLPKLFRAAQRGLVYPQHGLTGVGFRCVRRL